MTRRELLFAAAPAAAAQIGQDRAKRVIDECVASLGGDRFMRMRDRSESGRAYSFYHGKLSGLSRATIYTRYLVAPEKPEPGKLYVRERQAFGKNHEYGVLFDEEKGYQISFRGASPLPEETVKRYRDTTRRNIFYLFRQRLREPGMLFESKGSDVIENQPVDVVEITDSGNNGVTVYIHQSQKVPVQQVFYRRDAQRERHQEVTLYSKYREVEGVKWPYAITRRRDGEMIYQIFSESVQVNKDLSDGLFTLPANMNIVPLK